MMRTIISQAQPRFWAHAAPAIPQEWNPKWPRTMHQAAKALMLTPTMAAKSGLLGRLTPRENWPRDVETSLTVAASMTMRK